MSDEDAGANVWRGRSITLPPPQRWEPRPSPPAAPAPQWSAGAQWAAPEETTGVSGRSLVFALVSFALLLLAFVAWDRPAAEPPVVSTPITVPASTAPESGP